MRSKTGSGAGAPPALLPLLGYGCLYAWGYVSWETPALSTQALDAGGVDLSWLVSAVSVPLALAAVTLLGRRRDVRPANALLATVFLLGVFGTLASTASKAAPSGSPSLALAVAGGLGTAGASALLVVLWALAFCRFAPDVVERAVPSSFLVSLACALFAPLMPIGPALLVALALLAACVWCLALVRDGLEAGRYGRGDLWDGGANHAAERPEDGPAGVARVLAFGVVAWGVASLIPSAAPLEAGQRYVLGIDAVSAVGFAAAIAVVMGIIRYAARVDFQALASASLVLLSLSAALFPLGGLAAAAGTALNVAVGACFEMILMLCFVGLAQRKESRQTFWVSLGAASGYLGVLLGTLGGFALESAALPPAAGEEALLLCLAAYALSMSLVPQRRPPGHTDGRRADAPAAPACSTEAGADAQATDPVGRACASLAASHGLTPREEQIFALLAQGRSQTYIRDTLFLSKNTVGTHVRHVYAKLGIHSKQELIDLVRAESHES